MYVCGPYIRWESAEDSTVSLQRQQIRVQDEPEVFSGLQKNRDSLAQNFATANYAWRSFWEDLNPLRANNDRSSRSKCDQRIIYYYIVIANIIYIINSHTKAQNSLIYRYWSLHRTLLTKRTGGLT